MIDSETGRYVLAALAAACGGAMNSVAGGGTLVTFPTLVALGIPPVHANATSTVALWPGSAGSFWGYRGALAGTRRFALLFALPSLAGGLLGGVLLVKTPEPAFERLAPWLVLAGTALFGLQPLVLRLLAKRGPRGSDVPRAAPALLLAQLAIATYGGYFGAGMGMLMLGALGLMGFEDLHRMNGLKNWAAMCLNLVAAVTFAIGGLVHWWLALVMAGASVVGGLGAARIAQRVPQSRVRAVVVLVGAGAGAAMLLR